MTAEANIAQVAATSARAIGGPAFASLVRWVIVLSLMTSISALVMTGPRVYAKMADDGFFPRWFRFDDRPPVIAIGFQALLAIAAIMASSLTQLLGYLGLTLSISSALTVTMVFVLRWRKEIDALPLMGVPAAIYVLSTLVLAVLYAMSEPTQAIAAAVTLAVGLALYPWLRNKSLTL